MDDVSTRYKWETRGIVAVIVLVILSVIIVSWFHATGRYTVPEAAMYISGTSVFATIALAAVIFYQTKLNEDQFQQNEQQSLILQESQWMPIGVFKNEGLQFRFTENRPYNPRVRFISQRGDTRWIELEVSNRDRRSGDWVVGIGGGILDENLHIDQSSYEGILRFRFESTTGAVYEYEYEVSIDTEVDNNKRIKVNSETRKLPWRDEIS